MNLARLDRSPNRCFAAFGLGWRGRAIESVVETKGPWLGIRYCPILLQYTNWKSGEPNNVNGNEKCAITRKAQGWIDLKCDCSFEYLCQVFRGESLLQLYDIQKELFANFN